MPCPDKKGAVAEEQSLISEVKRIHDQSPLKDASYYSITMLGTESGDVIYSVQTNFAGYTTSRPRRELREPSFVYPEKMRDIYTELGEMSFIINDKTDLFIFILVGGHGILEKSLGETYFPNLLHPKEVVRSVTNGFQTIRSLPKHKVNHAPSAIVRMNVLKRDNFRCKICGRSPNDHVDIELHVHHIHPWGEGGITEEDNLITLCNTCHRGLKPHFERNLFGLLGIDPIHARIDNKKNDYQKGVELFRKTALESLRKSKTRASRSSPAERQNNASPKEN